MAAKKKKKKAVAAKSRRAPKRKAGARKGKTKKAKAKSSSKKSKIKTSSKKAASRKPASRKAAKPAGKKKQIVGEGDYAATRRFDKDQAGFVARNRSDIPAMGKQAEKALDGPEGDLLRDAEATAAARSRDTF